MLKALRTYLVFVLTDNLQKLEEVIHKWLIDHLSVWIFYSLRDRGISLKQAHLQLLQVFKGILVVQEFGCWNAEHAGTSQDYKSLLQVVLAETWSSVESYIRQGLECNQLCPSFSFGALKHSQQVRH